MTPRVKNWTFWLALAFIGAACFLRLRLYGDLRLSIANNDTETYISAAEARFPSWDLFTGRRLFTTNLLYSIFRPADGYEILVNGSPATTRRELQPAFASLVVFQNILSALSWAALACIFASRLKSGFLQVIAALSIAVFAYTPQLVDWDSLLASESLTFSLFALQFGLLILIVFRLFSDSASRRSTSLLFAAWLLVVFFWTFLKDAHLYVLLLDVVALSSLFLFRKMRQRHGLHPDPLRIGSPLAPVRPRLDYRPAEQPQRHPAAERISGEHPLLTCPH